MIVQGVPPTPPALVQPAPIRVAAWSLPQLGPDDVTLDCQMSFAAPLVARHFQIRYSTSAGRAAIGNFDVDGGQHRVFFGKFKDSSAARLEIAWAIPDLPLATWPTGTRGPVSYNAVYSRTSGQLFIVQDFNQPWLPTTALQSRGTCQVVL